MPILCLLGASTSWTPTLASDLMDVFPEPIEFHLIDVDPAALRLCAEWGEMATRRLGRADRFLTFTDRRAALRDADAVIITISTGGIDADERDLLIAEKYRVYATVGDTSGPTGWSRALRNLPVFRGFAEDFAEVCPRAFVANYSNPLAALTATLQRCCPNPSVGLCHSYHQTKRFLKETLGLETWDSIALSIAGVNHFHWVVDFTVGRENGYELLRRRIGEGSLADLLPDLHEEVFDSEGMLSVYTGSRLAVALYDTFGRLPYIGDRHIAEFLPFTLSGDIERYGQDNRQGLFYDTIRYCDLKRTSSEYRRVHHPRREEAIRAMVAGTQPLPSRSSETVAEMILAYVNNVPFSDAVNGLNVGQIPGLPLGACVETLGTIDGLGVHPFTVPDVPPVILELLRRPALAQQWTTDGGLSGDRKLLLEALYVDPLCAHLKPYEVRSLASELLEAQREFLPAFA